MENCWQPEATDVATDARAGWLSAADGTRLATPLFQPVATAGSLRTLDWRDLERMGYQHVLMNTYHLTVRPGLGELKRAGGLKGFTGWRGSILTDSGGYQVHSLAPRRSVKPDGVRFTDHVDGGQWHFSPESVLRAQLTFGVDFAMVLDICTGLPAGKQRLRRDLDLTHAWAAEQAALWPGLIAEFGRTDTPPRLFGIVQGGLDERLRQESIEFISARGFSGTAVGGLAVGEAPAERERLTAYCGPRLPVDKPRYLMGLGEPADLLHAIACGFDMFDCVQPTRMARHGTAYTRQGRLHLKHSRYTGDDAPLDPGCRCMVCRRHSRAYLRHLLVLKEHSAARLMTFHNLYFYRDLLKRARRQILSGSYGRWWPRQAAAVGRDIPADVDG